MVRYDTYCDTGITIRYVSRYIYYPLIYEMQNCVIEVPIRIYYNISGNTYYDTIFSLAIRIVGAVYRCIVIHWWIVTSLELMHTDYLFIWPQSRRQAKQFADMSLARFCHDMLLCSVLTRDLQKGIYTNMGNARGTHADPAHGLRRESVCRNCVVLFTPPRVCCTSAAGTRRDRS